MVAVAAEVAAEWAVTRREHQTPTDLFILIASLLQAGEWTTYGDISWVAYGHSKAAHAVGRVAGQVAAFPNGHRVLREGGRISPGWRSWPGGVDECRRRLEAEGVRFSNGGADLKRRVAPDKLKYRLDAWATD